MGAAGWLAGLLWCAASVVSRPDGNGRNEIGDPGGKAFAEALKANSTITHPAVFSLHIYIYIYRERFVYIYIYYL